MAAAFEEIEPAAVAVGVPDEDLAGLRAILAGELDDQEYEMTDVEEAYGEGLRRFGEVRLPPAELLWLTRRADERGLPLLAFDLAADAYVETFTREVGAVDLLRYNARIHKLPSRLAATRTPQAYALAWDREVCRIGGFRRIEQAREDAMGARLRAFAKEHRRLLAVVDLARVPGTAAKLADEGGRAKDSAF